MHTIRSASKQGPKLIPLDLELEKIVHEKKKQKIISRQSPSKMDLGDDVRNDPPRQQVLQNPQNGQRTIQDFISPNVQGDQTPIVRPTVPANNFKIKLAMIQMIQNSPFNRLPQEDPFSHMSRFLEYYSTFKMNGVQPDTIRLILFHFP